MSCCAGCESGNFARCVGCGKTGCQRFGIYHHIDEKSYCDKCFELQESQGRLQYYIQRNKYVKIKDFNRLL